MQNSSRNSNFASKVPLMGAKIKVITDLKIQTEFPKKGISQILSFFLRSLFGCLRRLIQKIGVGNSFGAKLWPFLSCPRTRKFSLCPETSVNEDKNLTADTGQAYRHIICSYYALVTLSSCCCEVFVFTHRSFRT